MSSSIISLLPTPITVDIGDWVINNIGKVGVAKRHRDSSKATLYAVTNADSAPPEMVRYAKEHDAMILVSLSESEVNMIS